MMWTFGGFLWSPGDFPLMGGQNLCGGSQQLYMQVKP